MKIEIKHTCEDFTSFRAEKVKSLFNAESGHTWEHTAEISRIKFRRIKIKE